MQNFNEEEMVFISAGIHISKLTLDKIPMLKEEIKEEYGCLFFMVTIYSSIKKSLDYKHLDEKQIYLICLSACYYYYVVIADYYKDYSDFDKDNFDAVFREVYSILKFSKHIREITEGYKEFHIKVVEKYRSINPDDFQDI